MQDDTPLEPIAERRLSVVGEPGRSVTVTIGKPMQKSSGDWACPVEIHGLPEAFHDSTYGVDAIQALQLAFETARQALKKSGLALAMEGMEAGETGFPMCVPYVFGRTFAEGLERHIEEEVEKVGQEITVRGQKGSPG